jgi:hypothetical protein
MRKKKKIKRDKKDDVVGIIGGFVAAFGGVV